MQSRASTPSAPVPMSLATACKRYNKKQTFQSAATAVHQMQYSYIHDPTKSM